MAQRTYDKTVPDGAVVDSGTIDTEIQNKGEDALQRLVQGGHKAADLTHYNAFEEHDGKHCVGIEDQVDHNDAGYQTILWNFAGTTEIVRGYGKDHGSKPGWIEAAADIGGGVPAQWRGKNVTDGDDPGHRHTRVYSLASTINGGVVNGPIYLAGVGLRWHKGATGPTSSLIQFDVMTHQTAVGAVRVFELRKAATPVAGSTNILSDAGAPTVLGTCTIASNEYRGTVSIAPTTLLLGDWLVIKLVSGTLFGNSWTSASIAVVS